MTGIHNKIQHIYEHPETLVKASIHDPQAVYEIASGIVQTLCIEQLIEIALRNSRVHGFPGFMVREKLSKTDLFAKNYSLTDTTVEKVGIISNYTLNQELLDTIFKGQNINSIIINDVEYITRNKNKNVGFVRGLSEDSNALGLQVKNRGVYFEPKKINLSNVRDKQLTIKLKTTNRTICYQPKCSDVTITFFDPTISLLDKDPGIEILESLIQSKLELEGSIWRPITDHPKRTYRIRHTYEYK